MWSLRQPSFRHNTQYTFVSVVVVALACITVASVLRAAIDPLVEGVPFITFFPAVAVATFLGGTRSGILTLVIGGTIASYFWIPPHYSLALRPTAWLTVSIYVFVSGLLVFLIHNLRAAKVQAQEAENASQLYARAMAHRTVNLVALVQAVASMTFKDGGCVKEQRRVFNDRLIALGRALTAPMTVEGHPDVLAMVREVLLPFGDRISISGESVGVMPEVANRLALLFHELATNAVKYGSLSVAAGHVVITGTLDKDALVLKWREGGGPPVDPNPERRGFGSKLLHPARRARCC